MIALRANEKKKKNHRRSDPSLDKVMVSAVVEAFRASVGHQADAKVAG
jgi:hypothetical protein